MNIVYSKQAVKAINRMDAVTKQRMKVAIEKLPEGDTKQITGGSVTTYRLRVGGWRVLYSTGDDGTIRIEKIAPRGEVYRRK